MRLIKYGVAFMLMTGAIAGAKATASDIKRLVIIGDSLTEGYGVSKEKAYPSLLQKKIDQAGKGQYMVVNGGISGSTSASAVGRVKWHLKNKPALILLSLGANDGLRGIPAQTIENNLNAAIQTAKEAGVKIILAGMRLPPNYGTPYTEQFAQAFVRVAKKNKVPFIPFILDGVGGHPELNLGDGIHPNEKGHEIVAETVYKAIRNLL